MPPPVIRTRTSGLAIAGFVCSFFCGLVGLVLSIMGRNECRRSGGMVQGEGLALAGIIISIVVLVLNVVGILAAIAIPAFLEYATKAEKSEAVVQLERIKKAAMTEYTASGAFPIGEAPLTPGVSCCRQNFERKRKCRPDPVQFENPVWRALAFQVEEPHYFQYTYRSIDGKSFIAAAVGDLDCDGETDTYSLEGEIVNGAPRFKMIEPPPPPIDYDDDDDD